MVKIHAKITMIIIFIISLLLIFGFVAFSSKPSPVYGGLSLVASGGLGCVIVVNFEDSFLGLVVFLVYLGGMLVVFEDSFLGLVVFLVYLGGMLVVFGYTAAMATEEYPET
uniref:NADH-ubiquinone oxidoreductase chain 6 n=1 Tax=Monodelphis domestica TaxID=13616 RepID=A0A5F8GA90_MONDO